MAAILKHAAAGQLQAVQKALDSNPATASATDARVRSHRIQSACLPTLEYSIPEHVSGFRGIILQAASTQLTSNCCTTQAGHCQCFGWSPHNCQLYPCTG